MFLDFISTIEGASLLLVNKF